jgi:hypothetical protein
MGITFRSSVAVCLPGGLTQNPPHSGQRRTGYSGGVTTEKGQLSRTFMQLANSLGLFSCRSWESAYAQQAAMVSKEGRAGRRISRQSLGSPACVHSDGK